MKRTSALLQCSEHWGGEDEASGWKQWDDLIVLNPYRLVEPNDSMGVLLLKGCEEVHVELRERYLIHK